MLQEIACLISEPGSKFQPLHPDTPFSTIPSLYACFVALQDVTLEMGPTVCESAAHLRRARPPTRSPVLLNPIFVRDVR